MKILILTDANRWFCHYVSDLMLKIQTEFSTATVKLSHDHNTVTEQQDVCFLLSYSKIVAKSFLDMNKINIVVHASDLPKGKGMSPLTWQVLEGENEIPFCLFEAVPSLDAGDIILRDKITLNGFELIGDIREKQAQKTSELIIKFLKLYPNFSKSPQVGDESFYPRRRPNDSELDINKSIKDQFNLLRVCDNEAYPAFFKHNDRKYIIKIFSSEEKSETN